MYRVKTVYKPALFLIDALGYIGLFWKKFKKIPKDPKRILVIRLDHIGDMVMTSSFFRNLKKNYPQAKVSVLCRKITKPVAEMIPYIDEIMAVNVPWFSRDKAVSKDAFSRFVKKNKKKYDLVFELHSDPRNIMLASSLGEYSAGFGIRGFGFLLNRAVKWKKDKRHVVDHYHDLLLALGKRVDDKHLELKIDKKALAKVKKIVSRHSKKKDKLLLFNIGVGAEEREWGVDNFRELLKLILQKSKYVVFVGGEEVKKAESIIKGIKSNRVVNVCKKLSVKETTALTSLVDVVFGLESMQIHVAAALNKRIVYIHSSVTHAYEWGPYTTKKNKKKIRVFQSLPVDHYYSLEKAKRMIKKIKPLRVLEELRK
jgi:ADP-heptose:LPS heptosyltransferase